MFPAIIIVMYETQLFFLKLFPGIYTTKSLMNNSPHPFVQHYFGLKSDFFRVDPLPTWL